LGISPARCAWGCKYVADALGAPPLAILAHGPRVLVDEGPARGPVVVERGPSPLTTPLALTIVLDRDAAALATVDDPARALIARTVATQSPLVPLDVGFRLARVSSPIALAGAVGRRTAILDAARGVPVARARARRARDR
jgi:hypothetical protein